MGIIIVKKFNNVFDALDYSLEQERKGNDSFVYSQGMCKRRPEASVVIEVAKKSKPMVE